MNTSLQKFELTFTSKANINTLINSFWSGTFKSSFRDDVISWISLNLQQNSRLDSDSLSRNMITQYKNRGGVSAIIVHLLFGTFCPKITKCAMLSIQATCRLVSYSVALQTNNEQFPSVLYIERSL